MSQSRKKMERSWSVSNDPHEQMKVRLTTDHQHLIVTHQYNDFSKESRPEDDTFERNARSGAIVAFPILLYDMLEAVERNGHAHVVSWSIHGRCFVIHKPDAFKTIISRYFNLSKIASFQRQLNLVSSFSTQKQACHFSSMKVPSLTLLYSTAFVG